MKKYFIGGVTLLLVLGAASPVLWSYYRLHGKPRRAWKETAIRDIAHHAGDSAWVASEIATLKSNTNAETFVSDRWLSPQLILMSNGEWMAYANMCSKQNNRIHDIFIGRASDGKWYYSTYHFCIRMVVLIMQGDTDGQPSSVAKFVEQYHLREFDGQSDDCLQKTWPQNRAPVPR